MWLSPGKRTIAVKCHHGDVHVIMCIVTVQGPPLSINAHRCVFVTISLLILCYFNQFILLIYAADRNWRRKWSGEQ